MVLLLCLLDRLEIIFPRLWETCPLWQHISISEGWDSGRQLSTPFCCVLCKDFALKLSGGIGREQRIRDKARRARDWQWLKLSDGGGGSLYCRHSNIAIAWFFFFFNVKANYSRVIKYPCLRVQGTGCPVHLWEPSALWAPWILKPEWVSVESDRCSHEASTFRHRPYSVLGTSQGAHSNQAVSPALSRAALRRRGFIWAEQGPQNSALKG